MLTLVRILFTILGVSPLYFYLFGNQTFNKFATYWGVAKTGPLHDNQFYLALVLCFVIGLLGSMISDLIFEIKRRIQNQAIQDNKAIEQMVKSVEASLHEKKEAPKNKKKA